MTYRDEIKIEYFTWLVGIVCKHSYPRNISFDKLLRHLHNLEFRYIFDRDENRAEDGIGMRYKFACERTDLEDVELYLSGPCSMLEMMIALASRMEDYMDDPHYGDRTGQWFWQMISSLGLSGMTDYQFDREEVNLAIISFTNREYEANGKGGLFTVRNCDRDLRDVEIWIQACWYMNTIS